MNFLIPKAFILILLATVSSLSPLTSLSAADKKPSAKKNAWKPLPGAEYKVYKKTDQGDLHLNIYKPADWKAS
ncbi:MAG TPA: alpha/beta hydrolase, partial [Planctomycetaceae bacterium]|nr:alpha/beta hydrolase [Planctomycetaceae bacterium]